jgi:hypothetical protein
MKDLDSYFIIIGAFYGARYALLDVRCALRISIITDL